MPMGLPGEGDVEASIWQVHNCRILMCAFKNEVPVYIKSCYSYSMRCKYKVAGYSAVVNLWALIPSPGWWWWWSNNLVAHVCLYLLERAKYKYNIIVLSFPSKSRPQVNATWVKSTARKSSKYSWRHFSHKLPLLIERVPTSAIELNRMFLKYIVLSKFHHGGYLPNSNEPDHKMYFDSIKSDKAVVNSVRNEWSVLFDQLSAYDRAKANWIK